MNKQLTTKEINVMETASKIVRIVMGVVIMGAGIYYQNWLGAFGLLPVYSAIFGSCPTGPFGGNRCDI